MSDGEIYSTVAAHEIQAPYLSSRSTLSLHCPFERPPSNFPSGEVGVVGIASQPRGYHPSWKRHVTISKKKEYSPCRDFREEPPRASPVHAYSILKILRCCRDGEIFGTKQSFMETHCLNIGFRDSLGLLTGSRDSTTRKKRHDGLWIPRSMWTLWISTTSRTVQTGIPAAHQRTTY
jgi:hypothetical protein